MVYEYKAEGRSPKNFINYQNPVQLFIILRDDNANPRDILKNQIEFKSDLCEIKKRNLKSKLIDQISEPNTKC